MRLDIKPPIILYPVIAISLTTLIKISTGVPANIAGMPNHTDFTTPEKILFDGFPAETIRVMTQDGYINTIHRIPPKIPGSPVVMLLHGLLISSAQWVGNIKPNNLAYSLHNEGYDVWMPNFRGNRYSRTHVRLNPDDTSTIFSGFRKYWDFSFHEMGVYDLPSFIDSALRRTSKSKLYIIGHSMGTTAYFIMCSERPKYRAKIQYAILVSPTAYTQFVVSPMRLLAPLLIPSLNQTLLDVVGPGEYLPTENFITRLQNNLCRVTTDLICANMYFLQFGYNWAQLNMTMMPFYVEQMPAGSSTKALIHFAQGIINGGKFRQFDYGKYQNWRKYGRPTPPNYKLRNINVPMAFMWGQNDWLADPMDVAILERNLRPNFVKMPANFISYRFPLDAWCHADYIWAIDVVKLAYVKTLQLLKNH